MKFRERLREFDNDMDLQRRGNALEEDSRSQNTYSLRVMKGDDWDRERKKLLREMRREDPEPYLKGDKRRKMEDEQLLDVIDDPAWASDTTLSEK